VYSPIYDMMVPASLVPAPDVAATLPIGTIGFTSPTNVVPTINPLQILGGGLVDDATYRLQAAAQGYSQAEIDQAIAQSQAAASRLPPPPPPVPAYTIPNLTIPLPSASVTQPINMVQILPPSPAPGPVSVPSPLIPPAAPLANPPFPPGTQFDTQGRPIPI